MLTYELQQARGDIVRLEAELAFYKEEAELLLSKLNLYRAYATQVETSRNAAAAAFDSAQVRYGIDRNVANTYLGNLKRMGEVENFPELDCAWAVTTTGVVTDAQTSYTARPGITDKTIYSYLLEPPASTIIPDPNYKRVVINNGQPRSLIASLLVPWGTRTADGLNFHENPLGDMVSNTIRQYEYDNARGSLVVGEPAPLFSDYWSTPIGHLFDNLKSFMDGLLPALQQPIQTLYQLPQPPEDPR